MVIRQVVLVPLIMHDIQINCRLEGQDIAESGWNYNSASSFITLSFWIKI